MFLYYLSHTGGICGHMVPYVERLNEEALMNVERRSATSTTNALRTLVRFFAMLSSFAQALAYFELQGKSVFVKRLYAAAIMMLKR